MVADWGQSVHYVPGRKLSYHTGTRHWKAPELLFGFHEYTYALDIWSAGVMFLEMLVGRQHVIRGDNTRDQAALVARFVGRGEFDNFVNKYGVQLVS